ncbi:MAG: VCBS repeat-containing protein, partial [Acidobacteriota bacterium]|nr:VCBS repeat-containing protein [Acidobacteriota bacterium]
MPRDDDFPALNAPSAEVNRVSRRGFLGRFAVGVIAVASGATSLLRAKLTPAAVERPGREGPAHRQISFPGMEPEQEEILFHPHYRLLPALDEVLKKTDPRLDIYPTEVFAAEITQILNTWRDAMMMAPPDLDPIQRSLAPAFTGSSFEAKEQLLPRSDEALEIRKRQFLPAPALLRPAFLRALKGFLGAVRFLRVEFKIVAIRQTASGVDTSVRYDFVDAGPGYHRQQRVGTMNLRWQPDSGSPRQVVEWRMIEETVSRSSRPMFEDITARALGANKSFGLQLARGTDYWRSVLDGASGIDVYGNYGLAVGDFDDDGWDDLYVCQPSGLPNRLFRNRGDGTFEDVTSKAGVGVLDSSPSALFADIDNDGRQDLIVVRGAGPLLFLNQGNGKFLLKKDAFQFATAPEGTFTGAAIADYDRDGWLDIYFCLYAYYQGPERYRYPVPYANAQNGPPNFLFRNNRNGTFSDATAAVRLNQNNNRFSFACGWCDYDRDGWPDLYVANDFGQKNLYHNNRDGAFTDLAGQAGVLDTGAGMSVCWDDFNNDGWPDLYVADMWTAAGLRVTALASFMPREPAALRGLYRNHAMGNSLYRNNRHGGFEDVTSSSETANGGWAWSSDAWDFDQDGYLDLYIANGMISGPERQDLSSFFWRQVVARSPSGNVPTDAYEQGWNAINELIRSGGTWSGHQA